jgi:hypothetical protein
MARKYNKKSEYWKKFKKETNAGSAPLEDLYKLNGAWEPAFEGEPYYVSQAATYNRGKAAGKSTSYRDNRAARTRVLDRFVNIAEGILPYAYRDQGYVDIQEAIQLCQKAYANIPIFRNTIDIMSEFSNSKIYLEGGNEKVRKFIYKWLEKIKCWQIKDQYFREYYRSGNVFMYRIDGKYSPADIQKMQTVYGSKNFIKPGTIPIMYTFLNPYDIVAKRALLFSQSGGQYGNYAKLLSEYELESLRDPKTEYDQEVFDALPDKIKKRIKDGAWTQEGVTILLDAKKLIYSFYKKQDYEPFAMPFGFPVLDDLNWKIELKKIDQAIVKTVENVILLITMGAEPDKGGINPQNLNAMQNLFQNESVGRVLVSDYTTKADFVMPDLNKVLGSEKYKVVNEDIKEGLQNIVLGHERYSNTEIKAKIFLDRLKESRNAFINDFLQPQIKLVCNALGFRDYPIARFEDIDLKNETQFQRIVTRLMELGILAPDQGIRAIESGVLPPKEELEHAQHKFLDDREKGYYNPLVGGVPMIPPAMDELDEKSSKNSTPKSAGRPVGTSEISQEAAAAETYSTKDIQKAVYKIEKFRALATDKMKVHFSIKRLSKQKKELIDSLCESIIVASDSKNWTSLMEGCIQDFSKMEKLGVLTEINEIAAQHNIKLYEASLLYHSNN